MPLFSSSKIKVTVELLDNEISLQSEFKKSATGQDVLDYVCNCLNIVENGYFGLKYHNLEGIYWLNLKSPLSHHFNTLEELPLRFRVRFYPENPSALKERIIRHMLYLQLRLDLWNGFLKNPPEETAFLAALIIQAEYGDFDQNKTSFNPQGYVSQYKIVNCQNEELLDRIAEVHHEFRGMPKQEAENRFFDVASQLDSYGYEPYIARSFHQNQEMTIGMNYRGVAITIRGQRLHFFPWKDFKTIYYDRVVKIYPDKDYLLRYYRSQHRSVLGDSVLDVTYGSVLHDMATSTQSRFLRKMKFKMVCPSHEYAKHLWKQIIAQQTFHTSKQPNLTKQKISRWLKKITSKKPLSKDPAPGQPPSQEKLSLPEQPSTSSPSVNNYYTLPAIHLSSRKDLMQGDSEGEVTESSNSDSSADSDSPSSVSEYTLPSEVDLSSSQDDDSMENSETEQDMANISVVEVHNRVVLEPDTQRPTVPRRRTRRIQTEMDDDDDIVELRNGVPVINSPNTNRSIITLSDASSSPRVTRSRRINETQAVTNKKRKSDDIQPSTSIAQPMCLDQTQDDGDNTCSICFEEYTSSGDHRLVCLKCGHLFGQKCIEQWIRTEKNAKCPQCKTRARIGDVRIIFGKKIMMVDNSEIEWLKKANENLKEEKIMLSLELKKKEDMVRVIQERLNELEEQAKQNVQPSTSSINRPLPAPDKATVERYFSILKTFDPITISEQAGARCMDFHKDLGLVIACRLRNAPMNMTLAFGLKRIEIGEDSFHPRQTMPSHKSRIRSCSISPFNPHLVASVGEDKMLCVTSFGTDLSIIHKIELPHIGWSCAWMSNDLIAVGLGDGSVVQFCLGNTRSKILLEKAAPVTRGPVKFVEWVPEKNCLFIVSVKECLVWRFGEASSLFIDGITSFVYNSVSDHFSVMVNPPCPSEIMPEEYMDHQGRVVPIHRLHKLIIDNQPICVNMGIIKSRSNVNTRMVQCDMFATLNPNDPLIYLYFDEASKQIVIEDWKKKRSRLVTRIPESVIQMKVVPCLNGPVNDETGLPTYLYVMALADTKLHVCKLKY